MTNAQFDLYAVGHWLLGHSFVIRASSFAIFKAGIIEVDLVYGKNPG